MQLVVLLLLSLFGTSCSTMKVGIELLFLEYNGLELLLNENQVKKNMETILLEPENYTISAYTRRVFSPELRRTPTLYHSFYVLSNSKIPSFTTLSFNGTKKRTHSHGAWVINSMPDMNSYDCYKNNTNQWDVQEIPTSNGINTEMTVKNIIHRINTNYTYYYNDHRNDKAYMENCITALQNTLVENH